MLQLTKYNLLFLSITWLNTVHSAPTTAYYEKTISAGTYHTCSLRADNSLTCWGWDGYNLISNVPTGNFVAVSAGDANTCALRANGTLICWGNNNFGQTTVPAGNFVSVSVGSNHACGLRPNNSIACWGHNGFNQITAPSGTFKMVSAGGNHSCGLRTDSRLECWGDNYYAQTTVPAGNFTTVSTGNTHTCGLRPNGDITCWGNNYDGQTTAPTGKFIAVSAGNDHTCGLTIEDADAHSNIKCWGSNYYDQTTVPNNKFVAMSIGAYHSCGLNKDSILNCWGWEDDGQIAVPDNLHRGMVQVGLTHSCALKVNGAIDCWGNNYYGQLTAPTKNFRYLTTGNYHTCGIKVDDTVACWGDNSGGQANPALAGKFVQISAGDTHTCGIKTDGTLLCKGSNANGQITAPSGTYTFLDAGDRHNCVIKAGGNVNCWGDNTLSQATDPTDVFNQVSAGVLHTCGVKTDATVECWGDDTYQQLTPPSTTTFKQVSAGLWHTCGIKTDGNVACWGDAYDEQTTAPNGIFAQISVNQYHSCGIKTDGNIACWGVNGLTVSKIGAGSGTITSTPAGIDCGDTCSTAFAYLSNVKLTATPTDTNSVFGGWIGDTCEVPTNEESVDICHVILDKNKRTVAKFYAQNIATAPQLTTAIGANKRAILFWNAVSVDASYNLYQSTTSATQTATPSITGLTGVTATLTGLVNGTTYYFKVAAVNAAGTGISRLSNEKSATPTPPPPAPTIRATPGNTQVILSWIPIAGASSYNVYQGTSSGGEAATPVRVGVIGSNIFIIGLTNGTKYYFKMKSVNRGGDISGMSNEVYATPHPKPTAITLAPTNVTQTSSALKGKVTPNGGITTVTFDFGPTTNYGNSIAATPPNLAAIATATAVTANKTGLTCNATYHYRVKAINVAGTSYGADQSFKTAACLKDFTITAINLTPTAPPTNTTFTAIIKVENQGTTTADGKFIDVWNHQPTLQTCNATGNKRQAVGNLAARTSKLITFTGLNAGAAGTKILRAFVDSGCTIAEGNETNNQLIKSYTVTTP